MKKKVDTTYAETLGMLAFANGLAQVPAFDKDLHNYFGRRPIGDERTIPELKAWIRGYTKAKLAE